MREVEYISDNQPQQGWFHGFFPITYGEGLSEVDTCIHALVEDKNGKMHQVHVNAIKFIDGGPPRQHNPIRETKNA